MIRSFTALMIVWSLPAFPQDPSPAAMPAELDSMIQLGIEDLMHERFAHADSLFHLATEEYAQHPAGPVMQAALLHLMAEDQLEEIDMQRLDSLHGMAETRGDHFTTESADGRAALAFLSSMRGIVSLHAAREGAWLKALRYAISAASLGEDLLEADSTCIDAGLAVGNYYYWKSRRVEVLTWLPFVVDSRQEGIALLRNCASRGLYQRYAAINSLAWILKDAGDVESALLLVDDGLARYPVNRALLRTHAILLAEHGDLAQAAGTWKNLRGSYRRDQKDHSWGAYEALVSEASLLAKSGQMAEVKECLAEMDRLENILDTRMLSKRMETVRSEAMELRTLAGGHLAPDAVTGK